jgi:hypothetical protein
MQVNGVVVILILQRVREGSSPYRAKQWDFC